MTSIDIALAFGVWWIGRLLNALLRPLFCRYRDAEAAGDARRFERGELAFLRVLNACNCWPYMVAVDCGQLLILTGRDADEYREAPDHMEDEW